MNDIDVPSAEFVQIVDLPYGHGKPQASATLKQQPEDFLVDEELDFELTDEGEHIWLLVQKRQLNTADILQNVAKTFGLKERDIGYSGLKDKQAVTTQWISFPAKAFTSWCKARFEHHNLPEIHQAFLSSPYVLYEDKENGSWIKLCQCRLHAKKLKRGSHKSNRFTLTLRDFDGNKAQTEQRLAQIQLQGVPNYFGSQRFGHGQRNLHRAKDFFTGQTHTLKRRTIGLWLSAARSYLFNAVVAKRVENNSWNQLKVGDVAGLAGSKSVFAINTADALDEAILSRLAQGDIHPTAPMWGEGATLASGGVAELEDSVVNQYPIFTTGLIEQGLKMERRKMRLFVDNLKATWCDDALVMSFTIEVGAYATMVIREVLNTENNHNDSSSNSESNNCESKNNNIESSRGLSQ